MKKILKCWEVENSEESYMEIVRWNGALGDFTYLSRMHSKNAGLNNGDTIRATIIGNQISMLVNGKLRLQAIDDTFKSGNPGIGFFLCYGCAGSNSDFGFTSFRAASFWADDHKKSKTSKKLK